MKSIANDLLTANVGDIYHLQKTDVLKNCAPFKKAAMTKTDYRVLHQKLTLLQKQANKELQFCLDHPNFFKTTTVRSYNIARHKKLSKAIDTILQRIDYKP